MNTEMCCALCSRILYKGLYISPVTASVAHINIATRQNSSKDSLLIKILMSLISVCLLRLLLILGVIYSICS